MADRLSMLAALLIETAAVAADHPHVAIYRGYVVLGPEVETFRLCGSPEARWLDGRADLLKQMRSTYQSLRATPYQEIYAVLRGRLGPRLDCGFCEGYSGSFKVETVIELKKFSPRQCK